MWRSTCWPTVARSFCVRLGDDKRGREDLQGEEHGASKAKTGGRRGTGPCRRGGRAAAPSPRCRRRRPPCSGATRSSDAVVELTAHAQPPAVELQACRLARCAPLTPLSSWRPRPSSGALPRLPRSSSRLSVELVAEAQVALPRRDAPPAVELAAHTAEAQAMLRRCDTPPSPHLHVVAAPACRRLPLHHLLWCPQPVCFYVCPFGSYLLGCAGVGTNFFSTRQVSGTL